MRGKSLADSSEEFQFRVTEDGQVHRWRRDDKPPVEARWDICPRCKVKAEVIIYEFSGSKGKIERHYKCPKCDKVLRFIKRQTEKDSRNVWKEPEGPNK